MFFHLASHYRGDFDNEKSEKAEGCLRELVLLLHELVLLLHV